MCSRACFSKVPRTFQTRKASCQTAIRLFSKANLLTCFQCKKNKEDCEVWWLRTSALQRYKGNCGKVRNRPEKFPKGPWKKHSYPGLFLFLAKCKQQPMLNCLKKIGHSLQKPAPTWYSTELEQSGAFMNLVCTVFVSLNSKLIQGGSLRRQTENPFGSNHARRQFYLT